MIGSAKSVLKMLGIVKVYDSINWKRKVNH